MKKKESNLAIRFILASIFLSIIGLLLSNTEILMILLFGTSLVLWLSGLALYASAKGQNPAWCIVGTTVIGILIIALLDDKFETKQKSGKNLDLSQLDPETAKQQWPCPKCKASNPNTSYKCDSCGYSLV